MTRDELVSIVARTIHQHRLDGFTSRELASAIVDAVEPLIRADEQARTVDGDDR